MKNKNGFYPFSKKEWAFVIFILLMAIFGALSKAKAQTVKQDSTGNFVMVHKQKEPGKLTGKTLTLTDGAKLPIYVSANGKYYVIRTSKKGNQYKQYLKIN